MTPLGSAFASAYRQFVVLIALMLILLASAGGQTNTGTIRGTVFDTTEAVIPGAAVTAVEETRGVERQASTSATGDFVFTFVDPGTYTVTFKAENFAPFSVEGMVVRVGETASLSPRLELGATVSEVVVAAEAVRSVIDPQQVT